MSDLQFMLPIYFSEGVGKRGLPLQRFAETTSTNAARIFGGTRLGAYEIVALIGAGGMGDVYRARAIRG